MKELLTRISDHIAEGLDKNDSFIKKFHSEISKRDTSNVLDQLTILRKLAIWMLVDPDRGVIRFTNPDTKQYAAIMEIAKLFIEDCKDIEKLMNAHLDAVLAAFEAANDDDDDDSYYAIKVATFTSQVADAAWPHVERCYYYAMESFANAGASYFKTGSSFAAYRAMANKLLELIKKSPEDT